MAVTLNTLKDQGNKTSQNYLEIEKTRNVYATFWASIIKACPCGRKPPICGQFPAAVSQNVNPAWHIPWPSVAPGL